MAYQDTWSEGKVLEKGERECGARWDAVNTLLAQYNRPFTLLDIGCGDRGYFVKRAMDAYDDCHAIAVDRDVFGVGGDPVTLECNIDASQLAEISRCEHFDVVFAMNILHHLDCESIAKAENLVDVVLSLGDHVIVETPTRYDTGACGQRSVSCLHSALTREVKKRSAEVTLICRTDSHVTDGVVRPMWLFSRAKRTLQKAYYDAPSFLPDVDVVIASDFDNKTITFKRKNEVRQWIPGINLHTFFSLSGVVPDRDTLDARVRACEKNNKAEHGDVNVWNFIVNCKGLELIDHGDRKALVDKTGFLKIRDLCAA